MSIWPDRGDGRKAHYGDGVQPWDTALYNGWAAEFAAVSILKYLRRSKDEEHSLESAKVLYGWLKDLAEEAAWKKPRRPGVRYTNREVDTFLNLRLMLTEEEYKKLC